MQRLIRSSLEIGQGHPPGAKIGQGLPEDAENDQELSQDAEIDQEPLQSQDALGTQVETETASRCRPAGSEQPKVCPS